MSACPVWAAAHESLKRDHHLNLQQRLKVEKQTASMRSVAVAAQGACWHAHQACVASKNANLVYQRVPCSCCSHTFWDQCLPLSRNTLEHGQRRPLGRICSAGQTSSWKSKFPLATCEFRAAEHVGMTFAFESLSPRAPRSQGGCAP